jgi:CRP-like cAMP-binding protein
VTKGDFCPSIEDICHWSVQGFLGTFNAKRKAKRYMVGFDYKQVQIFHDLTAPQRARLASVFTLCEYQAGQTIFEQDERARNLYLVIQGEVEVVFKPDDGPEMMVARIKPQGVVGWSAAIGSPCYTSAVRCSIDSSLLRVDRHDLRILCDMDPGLGRILLERLAIIIAERLRNTHAQVLALLEQGMSMQAGEWLDSQSVHSI